MSHHPTTPRPCVFFDRDGIINVSPGPGYVERVADFHLIPAFVDALRVTTRKGYPAVVVTNQRGVGKGILAESTLQSIHEHLRTLLASEGLSLLSIYYATDVDRSAPRLKPQPGMLTEAAQTHSLDLRRSWMIGDNEKDVLAGRAAGCRTILVSESSAPSVADFRLSRIEDLPPFLEQHL